MRIKSAWILFLLALAVSCKTTEPIEENPNGTRVSEQGAETAADSRLFNTRKYREHGLSVFYGCSPRFSDQKDEVDYSMAFAARQLSIFNEAEIVYMDFIDENSIGTLFEYNVHINYNLELALSYLDKLERLSDFRDDNSYDALYTTDGIDIPDYPLPAHIGTFPPQWVRTPPEDDRYIFGVGVSMQRKNIAESWEHSDNMAMAEIARFINTRVNAGTATIEGGNRAGSAAVNKMKSESSVTIQGLYILRRWREPDKSYYYSLAIAEKPH